MSDPKVSIIITTYNEERFIEKAINSALRQSTPKSEYEIIVVDDGSTDSTRTVVESMIEKNALDVRFFSKPNGGTASARNYGIKNAKAPIVSFLDGDDTYDSHKIELSLEYMNKGESVGIVYSDYIEQYPDKTQLRLKANFNRELLFRHCIISTNSMVRKAAIERVGGFDETFRYVEDYDLWCRIVLSGYFALRVPDPLFTYNNHKASKTNSTNMEKIKPEWDRIRERILKNDWRIKQKSN